MLKKILSISLSLLISSSLFSQRETTSPFSGFGLGDLYSKSTHSSQSMGSVGIATQSSRHLNFVNPAGHSSIEAERFIFETGFGNNVRYQEENGASQYQSSTGLEYFACGFPIIANKWSSAIGILPFSTIGYNISSSQDSYEFEYTGKGGINQIVWGNSFIPMENIAIGFQASYLYGKSIHESQASFPENISAYGSRKLLTYKTNGIIWDFGATYTYPLSETKSFTLGAIYRDKQSVSFIGENLITSFKPNAVTANTPVDTVSYVITDSRTDLPQKIGFGIGYEIKDQLRVGADLEMLNWKNTDIYDIINPELEQTISLKIGCELTPNYRSSSYFKTLPYRIGFAYKELPITNNTNGTITKPIEFGISFGTDLLLRKTGNSVTTGFEIGKRGDFTIENSIQETYYLAKLTITLHEKWFFKRKID